MSDCRWSIGMSDCHVENDRVCRFAALVALAIAVWHVMLGSQAVAAEVDAVGAPAPVGFADIVERVKPAVSEWTAVRRYSDQ